MIFTCRYCKQILTIPNSDNLESVLKAITAHMQSDHKQLASVQSEKGKIGLAAFSLISGIAAMDDVVCSDELAKEQIVDNLFVQAVNNICQLAKRNAQLNLIRPGEVLPGTESNAPRQNSPDLRIVARKGKAESGSGGDAA